MLVIILLNVIIGLFISYWCLKELDFDFSIWSFSINFIIGGLVLGLSALPVWNNHDNASTLTFLASLMLIVGVMLLLIGLVMAVPKKYDVQNLRNLGLILEITGIIALITLWQRPLTWSETIIPEIAVLIGLYILVRYSKPKSKQN